MEQATKAGWTVKQYEHDSGLGKTKIYELMKEGTIDHIKIGARTIITTTPAELFSKHAV